MRIVLPIAIVACCGSMCEAASSSSDRSDDALDPNRYSFREYEADVMFGQSCAKTGEAWLKGRELNRGIKMAFYEHNTRNAYEPDPAKRNPMLQKMGLISYDDAWLADEAVANTEKMIDNDNVFAILGQVGTHTCQAAMPVAVNRGVPFFGGFSGAKFLRKPWNRLVVNYRASYIDETAAMIALFADLMFMAKISIMYQDDGFGYAGLEGVEVALRARSMTVHSYGLYDRTTLDIDPGLAQIQLKEEPEGIVMIGAYVPLSNFVKKAKLSYPRVYFSTVSSVGAYGFQKYLGDAESRFHVLVTQVVDSPFNTSVPIIAEYEKARSGLDAYEGATSKGDFISVEGYIIGRFAAVVYQMAYESKNQADADCDLCGAPPSREEFLDMIYDSGMIILGELRLGPFGGKCDQKASGCECNQGMRQVFGSKIEPDGSYTSYHDLDFSFASCGFPTDTRHIVWGQTAALSGSMASFGNYMKEGILAAFHKANVGMALGAYDIQLHSLDDGYETKNATDNMNQFIQDENVFGVIGSVGTKTAEVLAPIALEWKVPFVGALSGAKFLRWPFKEQVINVRPSYIDETAMMIKKFTENLGFTKISVFIQDDDYGEAGKEGVDTALRAHGLTIYSEGRFEYGSDDVATGLAALGDETEAIVAIGYYTPVANFIKLAKGRWPEVHVAMVSRIGPYQVADLLDTAENRKNIWFSQVVPSPYDEELHLSAEYHDAIKAYVHYNNPGEEDECDLCSASYNYNYKSIEGYMVGRLAVEVLRNMDIYARSEFKKYVYETQMFALSDDVVLGPYSYPPNYDATDKEKDYGYTGCNQGMRQVWLTHMEPDGSITYTDTMKFTECGLVGGGGGGIEGCIEGYRRDDYTEVCELIPITPWTFFMDPSAFQVVVRLPLLLGPVAFGAYKAVMDHYTAQKLIKKASTKAA